MLLSNDSAVVALLCLHVFLKMLFLRYSCSLYFVLSHFFTLLLCLSCFFISSCSHFLFLYCISSCRHFSILVPLLVLFSGPFLHVVFPTRRDWMLSRPVSWKYCLGSKRCACSILCFVSESLLLSRFLSRTVLCHLVSCLRELYTISYLVSDSYVVSSQRVLRRLVGQTFFMCFFVPIDLFTLLFLVTFLRITLVPMVFLIVVLLFSLFSLRGTSCHPFSCVPPYTLCS